MPDTGNPRFATPIWQGRYQLSPASGVTFTSDVVMLANDNTVQFLGDASGVVAGVKFATMPDGCYPQAPVTFPVCVEGEATYVSVALDDEGVPESASLLGTSTPSLAFVTVGTNGELTCSSGGLVHLNGLSYHVNDRYYL